MPLAATITSTKNGRCRISLAGDIDERSGLQEILRDVSAQRLVLNLRDVRRINSVGVRDWMDLMRPLSGRCDLEFEGLSCAVIRRSNLIYDFLPGRVRSFYAPYYCHDCDREHNMLLSPDEVQIRRGSEECFISPRKDCPECASHMDFNRDEDVYFRFLLDD